MRLNINRLALLFLILVLVLPSGYLRAENKNLKTGVTSLILKQIKVSESFEKSAKKLNVPKKVINEASAIIKKHGIKNLEKGNKIDLLYRSIKNQNNSELQYIKVKTKKKEIALYRYKDTKGQTKFYDRTGKAEPVPYFIRPVNGGIITSGWGWRTHPVLGGKRFHKGIDYGLPEGSKVMAAADGVIEDIGWRNNYGYYIRIRHNKTYKTAYAHLLNFADNIEKGSKVTQGQIIGYVGETGLATGPHLYYEVIKSGFHVNPLAIKDVKYVTISSKERDRLSKFITLINNEIKTKRLASTEGGPLQIR